MEHLVRFFGLDPQRVLYGNALTDWLLALVLGLTTFAALLFVRRQVAKRVRRYAGLELPPGVRLLLVLVSRTQFFPLLALSLSVGSKYLELGQRAEKLTTAVIVTMVALQAGIWISVAVRFYLEESSSHSRDRNSKTMVTIVQFVANLLIWSIVLLLALDNLGFQVKALLTGLGIGGIAVALAVQNVLGDLLASVSIALDKPFEVGDSLTLDSGYSGTVEAIGIKSTRLRSTTGEQIVLANAEIVKARIRNFGRLAERRSVFRLVLAGDTPAARLAGVPALLREAIEGQPATRFERAHFFAFGAAGLEYEVAFVVASADYTRFLDAQQAINLGIANRLEAHAIRLAVPAPAVVIARDAHAASPA